LINDPTLCGHILENFVANEILKHISWSNSQPRMYHFRTHSGIEADIVLEDAQGRCIVIEVKRSATINESDFKGINYLQKLLKHKFYRGVVLYSGNKTIPFNKNIHAVPIATI
jgi:predicted AAA+ superfamily ATPase